MTSLGEPGGQRRRPGGIAAEDQGPAVQLDGRPSQGELSTKGAAQGGDWPPQHASNVGIRSARHRLDNCRLVRADQEPPYRVEPEQCALCGGLDHGEM